MKSKPTNAPYVAGSPSMTRVGIDKRPTPCGLSGVSMRNPVEEMANQAANRNRAQCRKCGDVIESRHRHDFVWCRCKAIAVDGGRDYRRRIAEDLGDVIELEDADKVGF